MLLTDQERERFATYLEQDAHSGKALLTQAENLPAPLAKTIVDRLKMEILAAEIVAKKLRSVTLEHIGKS